MLTLPANFQSFEALNQRAVAVVVDPIQSVKGKVVIDAFRCAPCLSWHPACNVPRGCCSASPYGAPTLRSRMFAHRLHLLAGLQVAPSLRMALFL